MATTTVQSTADRKRFLCGGIEIGCIAIFVLLFLCHTFETFYNRNENLQSAISISDGVSSL